MKLTSAAAVLLLVLLGASSAAADPCEAPLPPAGASFIGPVVYVGDGDSLCVASQRGREGYPSTWVEVRLSDFYAPELHAPGGKVAKWTLARLVRKRVVQCTAGRRSYDRVVARCSLRGRSVADLMRQAGVVEGGNGR